MTGALLELTEGRRRELEGLVSSWLARRGDGDRRVAVLEVELLRPGRPGLLDVLADVDDRLAHVVLAVLDPAGSPGKVLEEAVLGQLDDVVGAGLVVDALYDGELAPLLLSTVTGESGEGPSGPPVADEESNVCLAFPDRCALTVFTWLHDGPHPGVEMLAALDEVGFNHLAAPIALWRRGGRDLGTVVELFPGSADGWALGRTSLRDLYGSGGPPQEAGGDFAPEARALGQMTARLHLALDRAFGRRGSTVGEWVAGAKERIGATDPSLLESGRGAAAVESLRGLDLALPAIRTHGDLHLGRTVRTDQGWLLGDCKTGGRVAGSAQPVFRSPIGDVGDLLWSLRTLAATTAASRDAAGRTGVALLGQAWEARNRRAFLSGYLATTGIGELVPADPDLVQRVATVFELERVAGSPGDGGEGA